MVLRGSLGFYCSLGFLEVPWDSRIPGFLRVLGFLRFPEGWFFLVLPLNPKVFIGTLGLKPFSLVYVQTRPEWCVYCFPSSLQSFLTKSKKCVNPLRTYIIASITLHYCQASQEMKAQKEGKKYIRLMHRGVIDLKIFSYPVHALYRRCNQGQKTIELTDTQVTILQW